MALKGIKVIEFAGLAPGPFCGMILSDFGAKVIRVDKPNAPAMDVCSRGKRSIAVDMKVEEGTAVIKRLCSSADVLIEPFRAGVMEKLGLGPKILLKANPRLIYARLTGFGQTGPLAKRAGHDINYLALSGVLSSLGRKGENPYAPINLLADFAGGGLLCALGITLALIERSRSGQGQVIDTNMVQGAAYVSSFLWTSKALGLFDGARGENILDGGAHYYETYETSDGKYMSVGAIEPQFYDKLLTGLGLTHDEAPQHGSDQLNQKFATIFKSKTQNEWRQIFDNVDACVMPVLSKEDAKSHPHSMAQKSFIETNPDGIWVPKPAPHLERTPACDPIQPKPRVGEHTLQILTEHGFNSREIKQLVDSNTVMQDNTSRL